MKPILLLIMSIALFTSDSGFADDSGSRDPYEDAMAGNSLKPAEALELEAALIDKPNDISSRTKLLGYYFSGKGRTAENKLKKRDHILWVIRHQPESDLAGLPYTQLHPVMDADGYVEVKKLWLEQIEKHADNAMVLGNAASFFLQSDPEIAEDLLKKAAALEPTNPKWPDQLGQLYSFSDGKDAAAKAFAEYEKAQSMDKDAMTRTYRLDTLTKAAFSAGALDKASEYAIEALEQSQKKAKDWNTGNAIHHANNTLGRIALKKGDQKLAGEYLLKAGATPGSPQLNSFGPNMSLAKELLEAGEKQVVLDYFALCQKFWKSGADRLDHWTKEVGADVVPDFGGNLLY